MLLSLVVFLATPTLSNWAWVGGSPRTNVPSSNLGLFQEAPSVTPGGLASMGYLTNGSYIITFGGFTSATARSNIIWRYNIESRMWAPVFISTSLVVTYGIKGVFAPVVVPAPVARPMLFLDNVLNSMFAFGGYLNDGIFDNNMFEFNLERNMWRWIHGPGFDGDLGFFGELGVESPLNVPRARYSQAYFYDQLTRTAYIYGGFSTDHDVSADHWIYSVVNNTWTWIHGVKDYYAAGVYGEMGVGTVATRPGSRASPCFTFDEIDRKFYIFGGIGTSSSLQRGAPIDLWLYEPDRNVWTWLAGSTGSAIDGNYGVRGLTEPGNFPKSRIDSPMVIDHKSHKLYMFSGLLNINEEDKSMNDLWVFDLELLIWTWIAGVSSFDAPGRFGTFAVASASNNPPARHQAMTVFHNATGRLFMFGGRTSAKEPLADMWAYFLNLNNTQNTSSSSSHGTTLRRTFVSDTATSNQVNIVIFVAVSVVIVVAVAGFLILVIRRRKLNETTRLPDSSAKNLTAVRIATGNITLAPTSVGLSLPGHLLVQEADFRCGELIASGGGGDVYRGEAISRGLIRRCSELVIKRLKVSNNLSFKLFEQEVSIMYLLHGSQFVAKIVGFSTEPPILLMKLYPDGSLTSFASKRPPNRKWKLRFSLDIARGLRDIHHADIAHCDMKPQNVLIDRGVKGKPFCVITDFGIAQVLSEKLLVVKYTEAVSVRGLSVQYAAPEVFLRFRNKLNNKAPNLLKLGDVYALGMIFKFLLSRKEPWD